MESQDYDLVQQESREQLDREIYQDLKEEVTQALEDIMCQANKDELKASDLIEAIQDAFHSSQDSIISIKEMRV